MEDSFEQDAQGNILKFVETEIKSHSPPNLKGKDIHDIAKVTFSVDHFIRLTGLASSTTQRNSVKVTIPVPIIAAATGQVADITGLEELLGALILLFPHISLNSYFSKVRPPSTS